MRHYNLMHKTCSNAADNEDPGCGPRSTNSCEKLKNLPAWQEPSQQQTRGDRAGTERRHHSSFCNAHGLVPFSKKQQLRLGDTFKNTQKDVLYYVATL